MQVGACVCGCVMRKVGGRMVWWVALSILEGYLGEVEGCGTKVEKSGQKEQLSLGLELESGGRKGLHVYIEE